MSVIEFFVFTMVHTCRKISESLRKLRLVPNQTFQSITSNSYFGGGNREPGTIFHGIGLGDWLLFGARKRTSSRNTACNARPTLYLPRRERRRKSHFKGQTFSGFRGVFSRATRWQENHHSVSVRRSCNL